MTPSQNQHVFVGYFQISVSGVVKHVQSIGVIRAFVCLRGLVKISVPRGKKKLMGCGLLGGISTQADTMDSQLNNWK